MIVAIEGNIADEMEINTLARIRHQDMPVRNTHVQSGFDIHEAIRCRLDLEGLTGAERMNYNRARTRLPPVCLDRDDPSHFRRHDAARQVALHYA